MPELDEPLGNPLGPDDRFSMIRQLWNDNLRASKLKDYSSYINFYSSEIKLLTWGLPEDQTHINLAISRHKDILEIARLLSLHRDEDKKVVISQIMKKFPTNDSQSISNSISFVLRIWLTLNVKHPSPSSQITLAHAYPVQWADGSTIVNFVAQQFRFFKHPTVDPSDSQLDVQFTAAYLRKACGLTVEWTPFLSDHLKFDYALKTLQVYYFKSCIFDHLSASAALLGGRPIIPKALLQETIWSLNLLFPDNKDTNNFLQAEKKTFHLDPIPDSRRPLDLNEYSYWRERLFNLRRLYMEPPESFRQMLRKRQYFEQRFQILATIVLGFVLAFIFGVISSVTAVISTRAATKSLEISREGLILAQKAYDLQRQAPICPCS